MLGVVAALGDLRPLGRVVQVGQAGVVELQVLAAQLAEAPHLVGVGGRQVGPELLGVRVHLRVDRGQAAAVVDHVRRGDRELGDGRLDLGLQVGERLGEDRLVHPHLAVDAQRREPGLERPAGVAELDRDVAGHLGHPAQLVDEVHVPGRPAELAVGGGLQADLLLHGHHVGDRLVLHRPQVIGGQAPGREILPGLQQAGRAQQASHVVGTERRCSAHQDLPCTRGGGTPREHSPGRSQGPGRIRPAGWPAAGTAGDPPRRPAGAGA